MPDSHTYYLIYLTHILADLPQSHTGIKAVVQGYIYATVIMALFPLKRGGVKGERGRVERGREKGRKREED